MTRMIKRIAYCLIAVLTTLTAVFSCTKKETAGGGSVILHLSLTSVETRADTPGDGFVNDGGGLGLGENLDLVILIADDQSNIVKRFRGTNTQDGQLVSQTATDAFIKFAFSPHTDGDYTVYAFGNTEGWPMLSRNKADTEDIEVETEDLMDSGIIDKVFQLEALTFNCNLDPNTPITILNGRIPLAAQGALTVHPNLNGEVSLELLRCLAKVSAEIINNTGTTLNLYDYKHKVYGMCPSTGYVLKHTPDEADNSPGYLLADPCTLYQNANYYIPITAEGSGQYSWYVFPSQGPYTVDISFTLNKSTPSQKKYQYKGLPVTNWKAENILSLARNQHLHVVTRISKGVTVSFNFQVTGWGDPINESVTFD